MRRGMISIGNLRNVEESRAGDMCLKELGSRIAAVGWQEGAAIDDGEVRLAEITGQPFSGD